MRGDPDAGADGEKGRLVGPRSQLRIAARGIEDENPVRCSSTDPNSMVALKIIEGRGTAISQNISAQKVKSVEGAFAVQGFLGVVLAPSLVTMVVPSVPPMVTTWSLVALNAVDVLLPFIRQLAGMAQVKLPFDQGEGHPELSAVSDTSLAEPTWFQVPAPAAAS